MEGGGELPEGLPLPPLTAVYAHFSFAISLSLAWFWLKFVLKILDCVNFEFNIFMNEWLD
jgi:hypothetical protein